ncbi:hypothetical protein C9374_002104 [Naegleria lovaniensis]|uniref:BRCT domain-containing protein n=1 Tax=Naegleria lovaniensis TaxID=51637 RepID=A0AA88KML0_NAELO|nr:uncharacterized protein C9374_002104 [Naegleria lovaniensis]KAG2387069.1 hypothetical protein C9374_002104 [Naegleria lovaniensis]
MNALSQTQQSMNSSEETKPTQQGIHHHVADADELLLNISAIEPLSAMNPYDLEEDKNIEHPFLDDQRTNSYDEANVDEQPQQHPTHHVYIDACSKIDDLNLSAIEPVATEQHHPTEELHLPSSHHQEEEEQQQQLLTEITQPRSHPPINESVLHESICILNPSEEQQHHEVITLKKARRIKRRAKTSNQQPGGVDLSYLDESFSIMNHPMNLHPNNNKESSNDLNQTIPISDPFLDHQDFSLNHHVTASPIKPSVSNQQQQQQEEEQQNSSNNRKSFGRSSALIEKDAPILDRLYDSDDDLKETIEKLSDVATGSSSSPSSSSSSDALYSESSNESVCYPSFRNTMRTRAPFSRKVNKSQRHQHTYKTDFSEDVFSSDSQKSSSSSEEEDQVSTQGFFSGFQFIIADLKAKDNVLMTIKENGGKLVSMRADSPWYTLDKLSDAKFASSKFVLIADEPRMKPSYVVALMLDIPLLKKEWLFECAKQYQVITDSSKFLHKRGTYVAVGTGEKVEVSQHFNASFRIKPLQERLFYNFVVKIISSDSKFTETWKKIFEAGGAKVEDEISGLIGFQKNFVLVKEHEDITKSRLDFCNEHKIPIIDKDAVLQLIISGKTDSIQGMRIRQAAQKTKSFSKNASFIAATTTATNTSTTNITQSLDDSIMLPCTPQHKKKRKKAVNAAVARAAKWFANVQDENPCDISIIDIRTPTSATTTSEFFKKKGFFENAAELQSRGAITHNSSFIIKKQPKLDKLDMSFSRSRLDMSILGTEDASPPEPAAALTPGDYFLKEESLKLQKTRFVRLSKLACSKRKHSTEDTQNSDQQQPWQMETFFIGDMVAVRSENIFESSTLKYIRIDKLHYKDNVTDGKEMQGTEFTLEEKSSKMLVPTNRSIKFSLSAICYKLAIVASNSNVEEATTAPKTEKKKKKSQRKEFFCDYAFKNLKVKPVHDPAVKELHALPHDQELASELELKREKRSVKNSIRFKNPQFIRFSTFDFNGSTFEEGTFLRLFTRNAFLSSSNQPRHNGTVIRVKEIREGNIAQFVNTLNTAMIDGSQPCPILRPSNSSSLVFEVFKSVPEREKLYTFTHEVEEILLSQVLTLEPLVALQKDVFDPSLDVKVLMQENDVIVIE